MKILLLLISFNLIAAEPQYLIPGYGKYKQVADTNFKTPKSLKVVFDVYTSNDDLEQVNRGINTVARFLNMHYNAGVKPKNMHTAIVIHGAAGKDILKNSAYNKRNIVDNPNAELLKLLHDNGVQIIVCGQTVEFRGYKRDEILEFVDVSLSAITALVSLQAQGYQLITFN
jgi:intracellular sulfur oxidation DsrE/DsrF family protein